MILPINSLVYNIYLVYNECIKADEIIEVVSKVLENSVDVHSYFH